MSDTIDQFMWGFQQPFRWFIEYETKRVLDELGMPVTDTAVILVGIATEESAQHTIWVEPETGPLSSEHLAQVTSRAKELYQLDPESKSFHTDPRAHEGLHRRLFLSARANAITEAIEKAEVFANLTFFVSLSSPVNGYDVHTCIGIPTDVMENPPAFKVSTVDRIHAGKYLQWTGFTPASRYSMKSSESACTALTKHCTCLIPEAALTSSWVGLTTSSHPLRKVSFLEQHGVLPTLLPASAVR